MVVTTTRRLFVALSSTVAATSLLVLCVPVVLAPSPGAPRFDDLLVRACAAACSVAVTWLWLGSLLVVATARRARVAAVPGVPRWWRRAALAGCGAALVAGTASPVLAAGTAPPAAADRSHGPALVPGLPLPELPGGPAGTTTTRVGAKPGTETGTEPGTVAPVVVVAPGDSLWAIAARSLPPNAGNAEIDRAWRALYARNAAHLGPDPDLILPGQRLAPPGAPRGAAPGT